MKLNAIGILCADLQASIAFYESLGLDFGDPPADVGHVDAELDGGVRLMLDTYETAGMFKPDFEIPKGNDVMALAVEFEAPELVDATFHRLVKAGHQPSLEPFDAFWGQRYAGILDPDGNQVDLYATLPQG